MLSDTRLPILDLRGKMITTFVAFEVASELESVDVGGHLPFLTDDHVAIESDLRAWAASNGHRIVASEAIDEGRRFVVEKGSGPEVARSMALVISTDGLEELLSPLGFALAAALEGMSVDIYFQGPGVRVLERGFRPKLSGWWRRPFSSMAAAGMAAAGHIAAQDKLRQLASLGAQVFACAPSLERFKVSADDLIFDDVPQVEYLSFIATMKDSDIQIYG
jgi:predicted peroxiredoxin/TusA-related sulfurtransferase